MNTYHWEKKGLIFGPSMLKEKLWWMQDFAQAPCTLIKKDNVRVFFSCRPKPDKNGQYTSYCGYVDLNRNNLSEILDVSQEPLITLGGLGEFDEFGTYPLSVIRNKEDILGYYAGWTRCESVPFNVAIGGVLSHDGGKTFEKFGNGPVLSYSLTEPFILSGPKIRKFNDIFYLFYIAGCKWITVNGRPEPIYKIRLAISTDGYKWKKINKNIIENRLGENEAQASPDVIYKNDKYHMFFCYRQATNYRKNKENSYRIGYAWSTNLIDWTRDDARVGITVSDDGFDSEMVAYPHLFELDGKINMFYLGNEVGREGFGLAELQGDLD